MRTILYVIILICIVTSCNRSKTKLDIPTFNLEFDNEKYLPASDVFSDFDLIPLETNEKSLISDFNKIEIYGKYLLILDYDQNKLFLFDTTGRFIDRISRQGKGSGEYWNIHDFVCFDNKICVYGNPFKLMMFDFKLNLLNEIKLPYNYHDIAKIPNTNYLLLYSNFIAEDLYNIALFDTKTNKIINHDRKFKHKQLWITYGGLSWTSNNDENLFAYFPYNYNVNVFDILNKKLKPYLTINFGKDNIYPDFIKDISKPEVEAWNKKNNYFFGKIRGINHYYNLDSLHYIGFIYNALYQNAFIYKSTNKIRTGVLKSDDNFPLSNYNEIFYEKDNCLYSKISADILLWVFQNSSPKQKDLLIKKGVDTTKINMEDNDWLIKAKLRNN